MTDTPAVDRKPGDARKKGETGPFPPEFDKFDMRNYYVRDEERWVGTAEEAYQNWQFTEAQRKEAARRYAESLRASQPSSATWEDFENYARQALGRPGADGRSAVELLMVWAVEKPEVTAALDLFVYECLVAFLSNCQGCGGPIIARPAPNPRLYHDDACRKRASRK
jgi:hypothetical protein